MHDGVWELRERQSGRGEESGGVEEGEEEREGRESKGESEHAAMTSNICQEYL